MGATDKKIRDKKTRHKKTKNKPRLKKVSLFAFMLMVSLLPLIISIAIVSVISFRITSNNLEDSSKEMLLVVSKNLASHCVQNEVTIINSSSHYDYLDSLKSEDIEVAIIFEDSSCVTSIKNKNGYRINEISCNEDLFQNPEKYENGYFDKNVEVDEKIYYACYTPVVVDGEVTGVAYSSMPASKLSSSTEEMFRSFLTIAVVLLAVSIIIVLIFSRRLSAAFVRLGDRVNALSKGDLKEQKAQKNKLRELYVLSEQTQQMQQNLMQIIGKVKAVSEQLITRIGEVSSFSNDASGRAGHIVDSVDELIKSAEYLNVNVQDISNQMLEIGTCVNDISDSVGLLYNHSEHILETNDAAKVNMDNIMQESKNSVQAVEEIAAQIRETNQSIERVDEAVAMILSISEETNLLSLNASIEAARAGENGRGFAVIAEEIFELSEQSAKGAEMIKELARTITQDSQKSVQLASQVQTMILQEQDSIQRTQERYAKLSEDIGQSATEIQSIATKTEELSNYKEKVIENVNNLSAISQENTANDEEVSGNISEIISQVQNINENCTAMNDMAAQLEESVSFFK